MKLNNAKVQDKGYEAHSPWTTISFAHNRDIITIERSGSPSQGYPLFMTESCSSTMDLAWILDEKNLFPEWSSVLSKHQQNGRGQFRRSWISPGGNLYGTLRLPKIHSYSTLIPLVAALAIQSLLQDMGLYSEFKWPNDLLVSRKKVGGILVEERGDTVMAGFGLNLIQSPPMDMLRDPRALPAGHLEEFGVLLTPLEMWSLMVQALMDRIMFFSHSPHALTRALENAMAFMNEPVVFKPHHGDEFQAVVVGLSDNGGIRLKATDGEKTWLSGSLSPVIY